MGAPPPAPEAHAKHVFLANLSHEMRTPLNAVMGFLQLLQGTALDARQREYLDQAAAAAGHLHGLMGDLLDFARIEAGRLEVAALAFEPRALLAGVAGALAGRAADKGLRVTWAVHPAVPERLLGDALRLGQVLLNLGDNALKGTEAGSVDFLLGAEGPRLRFDVRDTGSAMSERELAGLFRPPTEADESSPRRFGSTGLGLALADRLTRLMGGELQVANLPGQGNRFTVLLALPEAGAGAVPPPTTPVQGVDMADALERLELDPETYLELLRHFGEEQGEQLEILAAALARDDRALALRHAHALKGAALNLGAGAVGAAARDLEDCLGRGAAWPEPLARLRAALRELTEGLVLLQVPGESPAPAAPERSVLLEVLAALERDLRQDDARARRDLAELAALVRGSALQAALGPLKARIEAYDYGRALQVLPAFLARVEALAPGR